MEEDKWLSIEIALWSKICEDLKSQDIINLSSTCSTLWEELKKKRAKAIIRLSWKDDYQDICFKTKSPIPEDWLHKKLPLYTRVSSEEKIRVVANTENGYRFEIPTPDEYCITGIECDSLNSLSPNCVFDLCYNGLRVNVVGMNHIAVLQNILGLEKNKIPFPMVKGGIPLPSNDDVRIDITNRDDGNPVGVEITYLLERLKTPNSDPFIIYQYQSMPPTTLDGEKTVEVRFSHYIGYILIHSEPFYDGPVEAVFEFDGGNKRRVLLLPEDKSLRIDNWRVFRLRKMKASSLDKYPLISRDSNFVCIHFLYLEKKTRVDISVISANITIIYDGHLRHPSML
uniref:Uncharacterized protein n=1 Tax=Marseillevirus LCMAC101 TaxID=2506602 RepID=A0A481YS41_9VIRU|nr:MAG: hypothetical protein LCMAC101_04540 [Marseillevirus LCMAC101]